MSTEFEENGSEFGSDTEGAPNRGRRLARPNFNSKWIYFYHLKRHTDPVAAYRIEWPSSVPYAQMPTVVDQIFSNLGQYSSSGSDIGDIVWRHKAYIVLVLEHATDKMTGAEFKRRPGNTNNTFEDGDIIPSVANRNDVSAFYCVNYMRGAHGRDLGQDEAEVYRVKALHRRRSGGGRSSRGHEDAGTNLGPPRT